MSRPVITRAQLDEMSPTFAAVLRERNERTESERQRDMQLLLLASMGVDVDSLRDGVAETTITDNDSEVIVMPTGEFCWMDVES